MRKVTAEWKATGTSEIALLDDMMEAAGLLKRTAIFEETDLLFAQGVSFVTVDEQIIPTPVDEFVPMKACDD